MDEIVLGGQTIPFTLVRKRIKNINLHIQKDGSIFVSAPARVPKAYVLQVLHEKEAFLLRTREALLRRQQQAPPPKAFVEGETFRLLGRFYTLKRVRTPGVAAEGGALLCGPGDPKKLVPAWLRKAGECVFQKPQTPRVSGFWPSSSRCRKASSCGSAAWCRAGAAAIPRGRP